MNSMKEFFIESRGKKYNTQSLEEMKDFVKGASQEEITGFYGSLAQWEAADGFSVNPHLEVFAKNLSQAEALVLRQERTQAKEQINLSKETFQYQMKDGRNLTVGFVNPDVELDMIFKQDANALNSVLDAAKNQLPDTFEIKQNLQRLEEIGREIAKNYQPQQQEQQKQEEQKQGFFSSLIARKHTILVGQEPVHLWIKGNEVTNCEVMGKKMKLEFDKSVVDALKDSPARMLNASHFIDNDAFKNEISRAFKTQLQFAIESQDIKTLTRFAQSDLVPDGNQKKYFLYEINSPKTVLGQELNDALNSAKVRLRGVSQRMANFVDRLQDKLIPTQNKHLQAWQKKELEKSPDLFAYSQDFNPNEYKSLHDYTKNFLNGRVMSEAVKNELDGKYYRGALMRAGGDLNLMKQMLNHVAKENDMSLQNENMKKSIEALKRQVQVLQMPNETLKHFEQKAQYLNQMERIELLCENKEYKGLSNEDKLRYENAHIYTYEPAKSVAVELDAIKDAMKTIANDVRYKQELVERVQNLTSEKAFQSMQKGGELDLDELGKYQGKIELLAKQEQRQERPLTKEDLQKENVHNYQIRQVKQQEQAQANERSA